MDKDILLELLGLGKEHILDEYRENFKKDDFSAKRRHTDEDYENGTISLEDQSDMAHIKDIHAEFWNALAKEKGLKYHPSCYGKDFPLSVLRDSNGRYIAEILYDLDQQNHDAIEEILEGALEHRPELFFEPGAADEFLSQRMSDLMDTMKFTEIAAIADGNLTHEDFSNCKQNYPKKDFDRKWNHTRTKTHVVSMEDVDKAYPAKDNDGPDVDIKDIFARLPEQDRAIITLHLLGFSQKEIAEKLGYKTHSAIGKRLQKIKEQLKSMV